MYCNCNCQKEDIAVFQVGDTIDISFRLDTYIENAEYWISVINTSSKKQVLLKKFDELVQLPDNCFLLNIPHSITATMLPRDYMCEIAMKSGDTVDVVSNVLRFRLEKNTIGREI